MKAAEPIAVPETATLEAALALAEAVRAADGPVRLRADAVRAMSTPYVLTLVAALRDESTPPIVVEGPSAAFMDAFSDLGLFGDLMKMEFV